MFAMCVFKDLMTERFFTSVMNSVVFWAIALFCLAISYMVMDKVLLRGIHLGDELRKGNTAVAIVIAAFLGAVGLVIFGVTN